jgi:hypothetical protein
MFCKAPAPIQGRPKGALNACIRYIYGIPRYQHISEHANRIFGCSLDKYYNLRICCAMHHLIGSGRPGYLFNGLQFGRSAWLFNLILPGYRTSARAMLWNDLPQAVRRESSLRRFRNETLLKCVDLQLLMCEFFLTQSKWDQTKHFLTLAIHPNFLIRFFYLIMYKDCCWCQHWLIFFHKTSSFHKFITWSNINPFRCGFS